MKTDLLKKMLFEADNYSNLDDLEKLAETEGLLQALPLQPLFLAVKKSSLDQVATILPKLNPQQRQNLLDLDLWHRDALDVNSFEFWPAVYSKCQDFDTIQEFSKSEQFLLYLKSVCNIYTFDVEDPQYPDHDNYFLTDDNLLLIEYAEDYPLTKEIQYMVKNLYGDLGVEKAYQLLFKIVSESHMVLTEELYQDKKERLRDYGFVDYYDALELKAHFRSIKHVDAFIREKTEVTGSLDDIHKLQGLHSTTIIPFKSGMESIHAELIKVEDEKRSDFLQFDFMRVVNGTIALENALKEGAVAMTRVGRVTKQYLELGLSYIATKNKVSSDQSIFNVFSFSDIFKVGASLLSIEQKKLKKASSETVFDVENDYFYGTFWNHYLDSAFDEQVKVVHFKVPQGEIINSYETFRIFESYNKLYIEVLPYIERFYKAFTSMIEEGKVQNEFYLNYDVSDIDFEAILLSSFINFALGNYNENTQQKMGLTIEELREFIKNYFEFKNNEHNVKPLDQDFKSKLLTFAKSFGMDEVPYYETYLYYLIRDNLEGYNFEILGKEEFKHVGGPILLNIKA